MTSSDEIQEKPPRAERLDGYVIRSSTPDDAAAITALANLPGYRYGTLRLPFQTVAETRQYLENPAPGAKKLVADMDGVIIGDIFLGPLQGRRRHVGTIGMGVHDDFVGRGVGSALMKAAIDLADNWLNLHRLELDVFTDNQDAIRLYERYGFVIEGHLRDDAFRDGHYVDAYAMARLKT
jgi:putative acetyltransferase